jgi:hypothetical protein
MTRRDTWCAVALVSYLGLAGAVPVSSAQELSTSHDASAPPDTVAPPLKAQLQAEALVVTRGAARIEFWWVRSLALESAAGGAPSWSQVPDGALVGVMRTTDPLPDIRGVPIAPGVYTLRFALQPQNGDHLGASPYREFIVVGPAAADPDSNPVGYDTAVELGKKTLGRSHPAALSIDPPSATQAAGSIAPTEDGHSAVIVAIPVAHGGAEAGTITFGLVLVGRIDH